ncbi:MAG TPA: SpoIVB peptidase S55 domain-containing protein [Labilithrix sp.]|nr:SpoIVB peptidase S55 domain-containing protein [Labilithrix sp.]
MRKEFLSIAAVSVGLLTGLGLTIPLARGDAKPRTISVDEIKDGMKGYGLTVFKGTEPERFDVEVVGVLRNFRPSQELILVKTPHPRLNVTKNVRGMSGSPIYLDGRLAGAYAYSWSSFQVEPVAGVTPIAPMLTEMRRPIPPGFWPLDGGAPLPGGPAKEHAPKHAMTGGPASGSTAFDGAPGTYDVETHATQVATRLSAGLDPARPVVPTATPLMLAGMSDRSIALVRKLFAPLGLEPVQAGAGGGAGKDDPNAPKHYVDGGGVGVQMARGDVSFMGLGTVTHVEGNRLCGFGHPMMEAGVTALPTAIGRVHWIFASDQHSSKIGEAARSLGALIQDRQSAIVVDETKNAPLFPLVVDIQGADGIPKKNWNIEIAEERFMSAGLVASVLGSIVDASVSERRDVTWKLKSKLSVRGRGSIVLEDFGVATGGMPDASELARSKIARAVGEVLNNPWELTHIDKVESTLSVDYSRDLWRLRGVDVLDPVVDAGQVARVRVHLVPFAGPEATKVLEVKMPPELAGRDVELEIVPGYAVVPDLAAPQNLADLLANSTRQSVAPRSLVVQFRVRTQGLAYKGHVADRLPAFALDAMRPFSTDVAPDAFLSYVRTVFALDRYVEGADRVKVRVRPVVR